MTATSLERRVSLAVVVACAVVYAAVLFIVPARFHGYDDAKYLGIGLNVLDGRGPLTPFGVFFEPHSPLWPVILAIPRAWLGIDPFGWAHILNIVAAVAVVALGALLGWRIRPAAGALAAVGILAFPYLFDLSRRVGLDMPIAALSLGYLVLGGVAARGRSLRWAIGAGVLFGVAALIKESVLPFAPVPFLAAYAAGRSASSVARQAAIALLAAAVVTSWWWLVYAAGTGRVYRLGTPAWTLLPLAVAILVAWAAAIAWDRRANSPGPAGTRPERPTSGRPSPRVLAWLLAAGWVVGLIVVLGRAPELHGRSLLDPGQIAYYAGTWADTLSPFLVVGGVGAVLDLVARARRGAGRAGEEIWLAVFCGLPLSLLVIGVGELPRHYVAQMVLLIALGASGWLWLAEAVVARPTAATIRLLALATGGAIAVLEPLLGGRPVVFATMVVVLGGGVMAIAVIAVHPGLRARAQQILGGGRLLVIGLVIAFVAGSSILFVRAAQGGSADRFDAAKAAAVSTVPAWLLANLPAGSTVAFGQSLSQEMAVELRDRLRTVQVRETRDLQFDPAAPLGIGDGHGHGADDWIALAALPGTGAGFVGYRASTLAEDLQTTRTDVWVQATATELVEPLVVDQTLTPAHGFTVLQRWSWPTGTGTLDVVAYGIDRSRLTFDRTVWVSLDALARLVDRFTSAGAVGAPAAAALLDRIAVVPEGPQANALRARLRTLAGR